MEASCTIFRSSSVSKCINVWNSPKGVIPYNGPCIIGSQPKYIRCSAKSKNSPSAPIMKTCRNCKNQFDPLQNHNRSCRYHTAHFGGETKRKFESVYSGGTMDTPESGKILQYWHCCGSEDPFDPGCVASPHSSYDDY